MSGRSTSISLSNLPGRVKAGSSTSFWLVAAKTITLAFDSNPSISTNNWFRVLSFSSLPPMPAKIMIRFTWSFFTHCVDLVNENNRWGCFFGLLEEVSHSLSTHTHIHLNELTSADGKKWNVTFSRTCFCDHCFSCARWSSEKCSSWDLGSKPMILLRIDKKINKLNNFLFRFLHSHNISKFNINFLHKSFALRLSKQLLASSSGTFGSITSGTGQRWKEHIN